MKGLEPDRSTMLGAETTARANVNVALVKYWGKRDPVLNLPTTGSISLTLDGLWVESTLRVRGEGPDQCIIDGEVASGPDGERVCAASSTSCGRRPACKAPSHVRTTSGVPTGAGLASSAAAFASVAVAASRAAGLHLEPPALSALARRGSGSASDPSSAASSSGAAGARADGRDSIAEPLLPANAWPVRMVVAVTSTARKAVSSRDGHGAGRRVAPLSRRGSRPPRPISRRPGAAIAARDLEALGLVAEHSAHQDARDRARRAPAAPLLARRDRRVRPSRLGAAAPRASAAGSRSTPVRR